MRGVVEVGGIISMIFFSIVAETLRNAKRSHAMQPDVVAVGRQRSSQILHRLCPCHRLLYHSWTRRPSWDWQFHTSKFAAFWTGVSTTFISEQMKPLNITEQKLFSILNIYMEMVEGLCYKPSGRGLETQWGNWISSICLILPAAPWSRGLLSL
jgi:hypothetical protein